MFDLILSSSVKLALLLLLLVAYCIGIIAIVAGSYLFAAEVQLFSHYRFPSILPLRCLLNNYLL